MRLDAGGALLDGESTYLSGGATAATSGCTSVVECLPDEVVNAMATAFRHNWAVVKLDADPSKEKQSDDVEKLQRLLTALQQDRQRLLNTHRSETAELRKSKDDAVQAALAEMESVRERANIRVAEVSNAAERRHAACEKRLRQSEAALASSRAESATHLKDLRVATAELARVTLQYEEDVQRAKRAHENLEKLHKAASQKAASKTTELNQQLNVIRAENMQLRLFSEQRSRELRLRSAAERAVEASAQQARREAAATIEESQSAVWKTMQRAQTQVKMAVALCVHRERGIASEQLEKNRKEHEADLAALKNELLSNDAKSECLQPVDKRIQVLESQLQRQTHMVEQYAARNSILEKREREASRGSHSDVPANIVRGSAIDPNLEMAIHAARQALGHMQHNFEHVVCVARSSGYYQTMGWQPK